MGKLRIPVQAIPPSPGALQSNSATLATTFSTAVSSAGNAGGRAIEGALLTACDYFNTSWLDAAYNPPRNMSLCYRGYRPGPNDIPPPNKLTDIGQIDTTRISRIADIPNMPGACQSAVIMITDGSQTTTADGQFYTPGLKTHESSKLAGIPITDPPPNPTSYSGADVDPLSGLTDPVLLALDNLKAMNKQGADKITTFFVGLGADWDPDIDVLGQKGLNDRYGSMTYPWDQAALKEALDNAVSNALYTPGTNAGLATATTVAASSSVLSNNILIFQAEFRFDHGWKGDLEASTIAAANPTAAGTVVWNAASNPLDPANRSIFSYIPGTGGTTFNWAGLSSSQQAVLTSHDADNPSLLVDWLRGDVSYDNNDKYRNRGGEGNLLGDIVNSDPVYVGIDNYAYDILPGAEGTSYASFLASKTSRQPVVYVGANDGMLHGFSIGTSNYRTGAYKDGGGEVLAYVPNAVIGLSELNSPLVKYATPPPGAAYYPHIYTVDGSPSVGDAYISSAWKTVLVGTTGAGGKSIFALDITNPLSFANANVLWEISDTDDATIGACTPVCRNITTGTSTSIHGDLGYTFAQPTIVRLNNGHWGAVVGNGYNSARGHAVLFIFDLADGSLIKKIDTGAAGNTVIAKNGLSTPIAIDVNGDRIADTVYAGDLTGNLWKFDISSTNTSNWGSAYNTGRRTPVPAPLFVACTRQCQDDEDLQPITGKPNIGPASGTDQGSGLMVYFGTGKYFELADNIVDLAVTTPSKQSFYALWDNGSKITGRRSSVLQDQTIETESASYRTTSSNTVDYTQEQGWYMDLLSPSNPTHQGERIVSLPIVRNGRIIFVTMTPNSVASCKAGGFSWVMEMEAVSGKPLASSSPWDTNGDGTIDSSDLIDGSVPSGMKSSIGIVKTPTILAPNTNCTTEIKVFGGTGGTAGIKEKNVESCSPGTAASGRSSWRHL
jgi:type IV pilus assembly protein PilY1